MFGNVLVYDAVHEGVIRTSDDFVWSAEFSYYGRFTIQVEFFDLKMWTTDVSPPKFEALISLIENIYSFRLNNISIRL